MDPVPETLSVLRRLHSADADPLVIQGLSEVARRVRRLVPECIGLSLGIVDSGITLAFVEGNASGGRIDALQYLVAGEDAPVDVDPVGLAGDPLDEESWRLLALSDAASGVESSLSIPIVDEGTVFGHVNLYASTPDAFEGHGEALAALCGAWAPGAVANADLSFSSRLRAAAAPGMLDDQEQIDRATRIATDSLGLTFEEARRRIRAAAARAGISEAELAKIVIDADPR